MTEGLEALAGMEYPGRFLILGKGLSGEQHIVVYGMTSRNPKNRLRKLVLKEAGTKISVKATDKKELADTGTDLKLLLYTAIFMGDKGIVVGNGEQTDSVNKYFTESNPSLEPLPTIVAGHTDPGVNEGLGWSYEHDPPCRTPRISGCIGLERAAIGIIKKAEGSLLPTRQYFEVPLICGEGKLITTYLYGDSTSTPPFEGEPLDIRLEIETAKELAVEVYNALEPKGQNPEKDFRISVAAVYFDREKRSREAHIINRHDT